MSRPRIGIIVGTTRQGRFADLPASWIFELAARRADIEPEIVDLRNYNMPFFDETHAPMRAPAENSEARRWAAKINSLDGYIFITAEYNHGPSAVLKNALDHVYPEFNKKPASFMGYGNAGGARAIEQLRLIAVELQIAPLKSVVQIGRAEYLGLVQGGSFADYPYLEQSASQMLDELVWWADALRSARALDVGQ